MTAELVLRRKCPDCGNVHSKNTWGYIYPEVCNGPGGSEVVLDPADIAKVIHDLQAEHGHETRHDIGLALIDALEDL